MSDCFECSGAATEMHHVVPRSLGGTATVPLCCRCHDRVHGVMRIAGRGGLTAAALGAKKARGERVGSVPYGYALAVDGVSLVEVAAEQGVIVRVRALRDEDMSYRAIAMRLESDGIAPRSGGHWHPPMISRMVASSPRVTTKGLDSGGANG